MTMCHLLSDPHITHYSLLQSLDYDTVENGMLEKEALKEASSSVR